MKNINMFRLKCYQDSLRLRKALRSGITKSGVIQNNHNILFINILTGSNL